MSSRPIDASISSSEAFSCSSAAASAGCSSPHALPASPVPAARTTANKLQNTNCRPIADRIRLIVMRPAPFGECGLTHTRQESRRAAFFARMGRANGMTMRRLAQQLEPFLHSLQRVHFVDLLVAAAFGIPTWLLAAVGGLATVYFAASGPGRLVDHRAAAGGARGRGRGRRRRHCAHIPVDAGLGNMAAMAAPGVRHCGAGTCSHDQPSTDDGDLASQAETESPIPARAETAPIMPPAAPVMPPAAPVARPAPRRRKLYLASELRNRLRALSELSEQLDGPMQEAFDCGHAMATDIADACRTYSKQEIIDGFNSFKSFTEAAQKDLLATVKKHPFPEEIAELGPWDCGPVVDKTGVLVLLMSVVPEQVLHEAQPFGPHVATSRSRLDPRGERLRRLACGQETQARGSACRLRIGAASGVTRVGYRAPFARIVAPTILPSLARSRIYAAAPATPCLFVLNGNRLPDARRRARLTAACRLSPVQTVIARAPSSRSRHILMRQSGRWNRLAQAQHGGIET